MRRLLATLLAALCLVIEVYGSSNVLDYQKRVFRAAEQIERIKADEGYSDEGISYIKTLLPRTEQVEANGQVITVDNTWLNILLDSYAAEKSAQTRLAKLNEASGWLRSLNEHLLSTEAEPKNGINQSASREKISEILRRSEYTQKGDDQLTAFVKRIRQEILNFLRNIYDKILNALFGTGSEASWFFRGLIILGLLLALAGVARMAMQLKRGKRRPKKRTVLGEEVEEGMTSRDLAEAALAAARAGDFRSAIRKLYVSLLYELSERNLIELEANATNHDYLRKVAGVRGLAHPMGYLTDRFDYVWYGMFPPSEEDFSVFLARYKEALQQARIVSEQTAQA